MAKSQSIITDFSAGELSERIYTRSYSEKYQRGLEECTSFTILPQGGAFKTPGFEHVLAAFGSTSTRLIAFSMAHEDSIDIDIEMGNLYFRIIKDGTVINGGSNVTTPYTTAQLNDIQFVQDGNLMYFVHGSHAPRLLTRTSDASWALSTPTFTDLPQNAFNDASSPTPSDGTFVLTEGGTWVAGDTFVLDAGGWYTAAIAWNSNFTTLIANVKTAIENALATETELVQAFGNPTLNIVDGDPNMTVTFTGNWAWIGYLTVVSVNSTSGTLTEGTATPGTGSTEDAWSATRGWPRTIALHEQRLIFGGTSGLPDRVWGSATGRYTTMTLGTDPDDGFEFQIKNRKGIVIQWMESRRVLVLGTTKGDYVQHEVPITPTSVQFIRHTGRRSAYIQPVEVDSELFYVERGKRKLRKIAFEEPTNNWESEDATFLASHIAGPSGILQVEYAEYPDSVVYAVTSDNWLIALTYDRANQVGAWWRRVSQATVLSAATIHNPTTGNDEIHALVEFGGTRYLWKMRATSEKVLEDQKSGSGIVRNVKNGNYGGYLDGFVTYDFSPASTAITGLPWADGTVVSVIGDDARQPDKTVTGGAITAETAALHFVIGLPYTSKLKTLPLEGGNPRGTSQAQKRRFSNPTLRMVASVPPLVNGKRAPERPTTAPLDAAAPLISGDVGLTNLGYQGAGQLEIEADWGLPCQITGIFGDVNVSAG